MNVTGQSVPLLKNGCANTLSILTLYQNAIRSHFTNSTSFLKLVFVNISEQNVLLIDTCFMLLFGLTLTFIKNDILFVSFFCIKFLSNLPIVKV